ncbi:MAG: 3-phosphoshikimate 1-carboxyvinyltransferase [Parachlamydiaceae bacterium]
MRHYHVKKGMLQGSVVIPSSKSQTLRAILFASLAQGKSTIYDYLPANDTQTMIQACRQFGAILNVCNNHIEIDGTNGKIGPIHTPIDAGNSGIVLRFCSAVSALGTSPITITGDYSICHQRPMQPLINALHQLNVSAISLHDNGYAPVRIQGPIHPGKVEIDGKDSQPVSALLIASAFTNGPTEIQVENPGEKPWVALTLEWFDRLGIPYETHDFNRYNLGGNASYQGFNYRVPGDFSSAAFPIAAALITQSDITLKNINMDDSQGDKALISCLQEMGAAIVIDSERHELHIKKSPALKGVEVDINDFIDAITILTVIACFAEGETRIYNASIAKQKECNRIHCIASELRKMGADITEHEDGLTIRRSFLKGATVHSHEDHRMAMSLTVAGLGAIGETTITSVECISKTYPTFLSDFNSLGANIESK